MLDSLSWTQVSNTFIDALPELSGAEAKVMIVIFRSTIGWHKTSDRLAISRISDLAGIKDRKTISDAVKALERRGWISVDRRKSGSIIDLVMGENPAYDTGGGRIIQPPAVGKSNHERLENPTVKRNKDSKKKVYISTGMDNPSKVEIEEAAKELIGYLNGRTGRDHRPDSSALLTGIRGRAADGFTARDIAKVFKYKCDHWIGTEWEPYLQPSTLLRKSKFDEYVVAMRYEERENGEIAENEKRKRELESGDPGGGITPGGIQENRPGDNQGLSASGL